MAMDEPSIALVTGAAHRLGRIFALTLAKHGYAILLHYHHSAKAAAATADEIRSLGGKVFTAEADITDDTQILDLFSKIDSLNIPLKVLVNSAARIQGTNLRNISADDWDSTFRLNLRAPLLLTKLAAERMTNGGTIINIVDAGVRKNWTNYPAYLVSKSGLETLTRLQAKTYAPSIRVNAIAPGLVLPSSDLSEEKWEGLVDHLPLKKPVTPQELASALEFLLDNG